MSDHYQVKFVHPKTGKLVYGIYQKWDEEAKAAIARGNCIVADAITPECYEVPQSIIQDIPMRHGGKPEMVEGWACWGEYDKYLRQQYSEAQKISDALPDGVHVGALFNIGVADGYAWYVVTKVNKQTCRVEWRGFGADRYTDHHFGWGGTFPIRDIARYVQRVRAAARLFGPKR